MTPDDAPSSSPSNSVQGGGRCNEQCTFRGGSTSRTFNVSICTLEGPPPLKKGRAYSVPSVCASGPHDALALVDVQILSGLSRTQTTSRSITDLVLQKKRQETFRLTEMSLRTS